MITPDKVKNYVKKAFPHFGINKQFQITRLIYETAKRERLPLENIKKDISKYEKFDCLKRYLVDRRYPGLSIDERNKKLYLPQLQINPKCETKIGKLSVSPKNIYIEESVKSSFLANRFKDKFPKAKFAIIPSIKSFIKDRKFSISDYNKRQDNFFIIRERFDFFKICPCTKSAKRCGYHIFNLGMGCVYECTYCYLQEYTNSPGIIIPANIEDFFDAFKSYKHNIRLGTGEFTDSLALDDITGFSPMLIDFFKNYPESTFEFKTKSNNIKALLLAKPSKNIVIGWSLNPQKIINQNEFYSTSLAERIKAAKDCIASGYSVAFHFDPIIYYDGWSKDYKQVVDLIFDTIPDKHIKWISLGTLRFSPVLKKIIENRFPGNTILDGELFLGFDNKMRFSDKVRYGIYENMRGWIKQRSKGPFVYTCMER
ncbi:MAG: hypothetical protein JW946_02215 [Candidatus Omnitrophica bacterium]|nr:hypothetical protein [Candidatus Omnitrophota bacterium]